MILLFGSPGVTGSVNFATSGDAIKRLTGIVPAGSDYSVAFWVKFTATPSGANYQTPFVQLDDPTVYVDFVGIFRPNDQNINLGATGAGNDATPTFVGNDVWTSIGYVREGTTHRFYVNGAAAGSFVLDLAGFTLAQQWMGDDGGFSVPGVQVAAFQEFDAALTLAELQTLWASFAIVITDDLWAFTPLTGWADLADDSGNGRDWTAVAGGVPGPAPFIDLGEFPFSVTRATAGAAEMTFTFTVPADRQVGLRVYTAGNTHDFALYQDVALSDAYMNSSQGGGDIEGQQQPFQVPMILDAGETLWLAVTSLTSETYVTIEGYALPSEDIPEYAVVVPDDTHNFPATVLDPETGDVLTYINDVPASETGVSLPTGFSLSYARSTNNGTPTGDATAAVLLNGSTFVANVSGLFTYGELPMMFANAATNTFWTAETDTSLLLIKQVSVGGAVLQTIGPIAVALVHGFAVNRAETIAYLTIAGSTKPVRRLDLATGALLSNLVAGVSGWVTGEDLIVLPDDSVLVPWPTQSPAAESVRRYSAAGTLLDEYVTADVHRIADAHDDGASFWVWGFDVDGDANQVGRFKRIRVSDGVVMTNFTVPVFSQGEGPSLGAAVTTAQSGISDSCPFWVLRLDADEDGGGDGGGDGDGGDGDGGDECVLEQPSAACWNPHDIDNVQVRLNG